MFITIIATIVLLGILIFVHELGHFSVAKALGVKVEKFSLGFPPKMISRKIGETEYAFSWIPLGGYVKMLGENPDEGQNIPPEEEHRSFSHKPTWARFLIVLAGPAFNFFFALLVFSLVYAVHGIEHWSPDIKKVMPDMPAAAAGLQVGDLIVSIDRQPVRYWDDVLRLIGRSQGRPVTLTIDRNGRDISFNLQPIMVETRDLFGEPIQVPQIGILASGKIVFEPIDPARALYHGAAHTWELTKLMVLTVGKLIQGKISPKTLGGPIFIGQLAGEQAKAGLSKFILLAAFISLNLGILNLLPIPVLDGGHLLFFGLEMIFRRPVSITFRERAQQAGLVFLVLFMVFIIFNDIHRLFSDSGSPQTGTAVEQNDSSGR